MRYTRMLLRAIPHVSIVISGMLIVFFVIDRYNTAMGFMTGEVTKVLIFILALTSIVTAIIAMVYRALWESRRTPAVSMEGRPPGHPSALR